MLSQNYTCCLMLTSSNINHERDENDSSSDVPLVLEACPSWPRRRRGSQAEGKRRLIRCQKRELEIDCSYKNRFLPARLCTSPAKYVSWARREILLSPVEGSGCGRSLGCGDICDQEKHLGYRARNRLEFYRLHTRRAEGGMEQ